MKKTILITAAFLMIICLRLDAKPDVGVSFNFFYNSLRPYGEWIHLDNNLDVWRPHGIHNRWRPYSMGRWNWTENGWYWDSDEPYGWATYHYGRWYNDDYYGWIWVPDYEWAPSWVEWRYDDDYIGWAPLPPYASFHNDFGIRFSMGWHSRYNYWNFVSYNRFCDHRMNSFLLDDRRVERIFGRTKYRTNYYSERDRIVNGGIDRSFIERKAGYRITQRDISRVDNFNDYERSRSNRGDRIIDYRPSERELENSRTAEHIDIKRGENRSSLNRDKVEVFRDRQRDNNIGGERTIPSNRGDVRVNNEREQTRREDLRQPNRTQNNDNRSRESLRQNNNQSERQQSYNRPERNVQQERSVQPRREAREQNYNRPAQPQRTERVERPQQRTERAERPSSGSERKVEKDNNRSEERRR